MQLFKQHANKNKNEPYDPVQVVKGEFTAGELHQAIRKTQLVLHYQPQIEIATGRLTGSANFY